MGVSFKHSKALAAAEIPHSYNALSTALSRRQESTTFIQRDAWNLKNRNIQFHFWIMSKYATITQYKN